jgi:hypothetical protein
MASQAAHDTVPLVVPIDANDITMNFTFETNVYQDLEDIVRLGAFGQFKEARLIVDESLEGLHDEFPIAVEIMRLMYDQGDFVQLYKYTSGLLSSDDHRMRHKGWTPQGRLHPPPDVRTMCRGTGDPP